MKFRDAILVAYRGLTRHWVRATLNVLGIVAGVASVIMLVSEACFDETADFAASCSAERLARRSARDQVNLYVSA